MSPKDDSAGRIEEYEHRYAGYEARDQRGEKVGHVDDLFVDTVDHQEYIELNMGLFELTSTLIPMEICEVDDERKVVTISRSRTKLRRAPRKRETRSSDAAPAITPEYEDRVRRYYELEVASSPASERPVRVLSVTRAVGATTSSPAAGQPLAEQAPGGSPAEEFKPTHYRVVERKPTETTGAEADEPRTADGASTREQASDDPGASASAAPRDAGSSDETRTATPTPSEPVPAESTPARGSETVREAAAATPVRAQTDKAAAASDEEAAASEQPVAGSGRSGILEATARQMTGAVGRSSRLIADRATAFGEGGTRLAGDLSRGFAEQVREVARQNLRAARSLQEGGLRQQQVSREAFQESVSAYTNFLGTVTSLYQRSLMTASQVALVNLRAASRVAQIPVLGTSRTDDPADAGAVGRPVREGAAATTPETAGVAGSSSGAAGTEAAAGQAPVAPDTETVTAPNAAAAGGRVAPPAVSASGHGTTPDEEAGTTEGATPVDPMASASGGPETSVRTPSGAGEAAGGTAAEVVGEAETTDGDAPEPSAEALEPPPAVPSILDELPPAPQAEADEDAPESLEDVLEPPPEVPSILDELPPPPQAPPVGGDTPDETTSSS